ncbi:MAG: AMP-binding protein [Verrucomicrobiota bacterium]|jgi:long-chain acyl-CoA synthetase
MNIELCRAEEVAGALGIKLDTLYRYARKGRLRGMKVGKAWRFLQTDIQEFLRQHEYRVKPAQYATPAEIKPTLLPDILRRAALESGAQEVITCGGAGASYAEVNRVSNLLADSLLSHGVVPGDRVLILLSNSLEFIAACFAVWKAGAILVAEDPSIQDEILCPVLQDCSPQALIVDRDVAERLDVRRHGLENLRVVFVKDKASGLSGLDGVRVASLGAALESNASPSLLRFNSSSPDDIATISYRGGAAGRAQGVMNTHENWLAGAAFTGDYHGLTKKDVLLLPLPLHRSLAMRQMLAYIRAGARIILAADLNQAVKFMIKQRPSALALWPDGVRLLPDKFAPALKSLAGSLRYVEICSASLEEAELKPLCRLLPQTLIHLSCNLTEAQAGFLRVGADGSLDGICRVAPTLTLRVVDEQGRQAQPGQAGWLLLKGPGLMKGFWGQSEHQMRTLQTDGCCTGDRAMSDQHGAVTLLGRQAERLEIGGHSVNPTEIEAVLRRHPRVAECAVVGLMDAGDFQTKLHAFVAPTAKGALLTERELKAYCRTFLPSYKVPARLHVQPALPKSPDGRILREALQAAAQAMAQKPGPASPAKWDSIPKNKALSAV